MSAGRQHLIQPSGRFRGHEVVDRNRKHLEPSELARLFAALADPHSAAGRGAGGAVANNFWYGYFRLEYYFGTRMSETALVLREDVDLKTGDILIRRLKQRRFATKMITVIDPTTGLPMQDPRTGKPMRRRVKDMNADEGTGFRETVYTLPQHMIDVVAAIPEPPRKWAANPWLFWSPTGPLSEEAQDKPAVERMANIRRTTGGWRAVSRSTADNLFRDVALEAGIPARLCHTHVLRHTRATLMLADGAPEEHVQHLLGHSSISTTRKYIGIAKSLRMQLNTGAELGLGDLK